MKKCYNKKDWPISEFYIKYIKKSASSRDMSLSLRSWIKDVVRKHKTRYCLGAVCRDRNRESLWQQIPPLAEFGYGSGNMLGHLRWQLVWNHPGIKFHPVSRAVATICTDIPQGRHGWAWYLSQKKQEWIMYRKRPRLQPSWAVPSCYRQLQAIDQCWSWSRPRWDCRL